MKRFEHLRVFSDSSDRLYHNRWLHLNQIKCSMFYTLYHPSLYKILAQNTPAPDECCCDFSGTVSQGKQLDRRALSVAIQILLSFRCPLTQKHSGGPSLHRAHGQDSGNHLWSWLWTTGGTSDLGRFAVDTLVGGQNVSRRGRDRSTWSIRWRAKKGRTRAKLNIFSLHFWFCYVLHILEVG